MSLTAHQPGGDGQDQRQVEHEWAKASRTKVCVKARFEGALIHAHTFDLNSAAARATFAAEVARRLAAGHEVSVEVGDVERRLLLLIEETNQAGEDDAPPEYQVVQGEDDPEKDGTYRVTAQGLVQLSNFAMYIDRDVTEHDEGRGTRSFEGRIVRDGGETPFAIPAEGYPNGAKFLATVFRSAGPKARVLGKPEALCRAVSALSSPEARTVTANMGQGYRTIHALTPCKT